MLNMTEDSNSDGLPGQQQPDAGAVRTPEWARIGPSAVGHGPAEAVQRAAQAAQEQSKLRVPSHAEGMGGGGYFGGEITVSVGQEMHEALREDARFEASGGGGGGSRTIDTDNGSTEQGHLPRNGWYTTHEDEAGKRVARFDDGQVTEVRYGK